MVSSSSLSSLLITSFSLLILLSSATWHYFDIDNINFIGLSIIIIEWMIVSIGFIGWISLNSRLRIAVYTRNRTEWDIGISLNNVEYITVICQMGDLLLSSISNIDQHQSRMNIIYRRHQWLNTGNIINISRLIPFVWLTLISLLVYASLLSWAVGWVTTLPLVEAI